MGAGPRTVAEKWLLKNFERKGKGSFSEEKRFSVPEERTTVLSLKVRGLSVTVGLTERKPQNNGGGENNKGQER